MAEAERLGYTTKDEAGKLRDYTSDIYDIAVLAGISDLEGLRKGLEEADVRYLERLFKLSGYSRWLVNKSFVVLLMLIYNARDRITTKFLVARGFNKPFANLVVDALDESQGKKIKKRRRTPRVVK